ncbi:hypothetical protein AB6G29_02720 [Providencia hangzhouensis]|uniref:hypothetical protein n=1 Tax=Providencia hangzhouensis TaxID=3031799 RepID=UPI0034DDC727
MKKNHLILNIKSVGQPYWPTLKLILSSLIVFNFYLNLVDKSKYSLLITVFDLTLIPMFVFIVAFITKNTTWKELKSSPSSCPYNLFYVSNNRHGSTLSSPVS